jgi:hypothetical protein
MIRKVEYGRPEAELLYIEAPSPLCRSNESFDEGDEGSWIDDE